MGTYTEEGKVKVIIDTHHENQLFQDEDTVFDIDDKVLVDRNGKEVIGIVVDIEKFEESNVPFPIEKTKSIIR